MIAQRAVRTLPRFVCHRCGPAAARQHKHIGRLRGERPAGWTERGGLQTESKLPGLAPLRPNFVLRTRIEEQLLPLLCQRCRAGANPPIVRNIWQKQGRGERRRRG